MTGKKTINTIIADDEALARSAIRSSLARFPHWQVVGECERGDTVLDAATSLQAEVVFLDINMPGKNGLALAREILSLSHPPLVAFVTAYDAHAVEAFELYAVDYLLKPFDDQRFKQTIDRIELALQSPGYTKQLEQWAQPDSFLERIAVKSVGRIQFVEVGDIHWIGSAGNYVELHLRDRTVLHRVSINFLEKHLDPALFFRSHRSAIVKLGQVREIVHDDDGHYSIVLKNGDTVKLSSRSRESLFSVLGAN